MLIFNSIAIGYRYVWTGGNENHENWTQVVSRLSRPCRTAGQVFTNTTVHAAIELFKKYGAQYNVGYLLMKALLRKRM